MWIYSCKHDLSDTNVELEPSRAREKKKESRDKRYGRRERIPNARCAYAFPTLPPSSSHAADTHILPRLTRVRCAERDSRADGSVDGTGWFVLACPSTYRRTRMKASLRSWSCERITSAAVPPTIPAHLRLHAGDTRTPKGGYIRCRTRASIH
ncbi:hypothetical protein DFH08DRAFT_52573 [Mycena albidolilacea]|uniref:Uncharacterized protein n=1 Tax=Mycena albidolilacea TaxID=1033008 RepID=A0AAD6Z2V6_9AGAR|nr:hypothetical protein DFH08DRAFT_52573 [Mycena albidolilacea]